MSTTYSILILTACLSIIVAIIAYDWHRTRRKARTTLWPGVMTHSEILESVDLRSSDAATRMLHEEFPDESGIRYGESMSNAAEAVCLGSPEDRFPPCPCGDDDGRHCSLDGCPYPPPCRKQPRKPRAKKPTPAGKKPTSRKTPAPKKMATKRKTARK